MKTLDELIGNQIDTSAFLASIRSLKERKGKSRLFGDAVRSLTEDEIRTLQMQGNRANDWSAIWVAPSFSADHILNNRFIGACVLGAMDGSLSAIDASVSLPSGIYNSTVIDTEIGNRCFVSDVRTLSNIIVQDRVVLFETKAITASSDCFFGNGREISVGVKTGGREVLAYAEMTLPVAEAVATRRDDRDLLEAYQKFVAEYVNACRAPFGVIESGSVIRYTGKVIDAYVGSGVCIDNALLVENCTIFGSPDEPTEISHGAFVRNSCVQWGCEVTSMAIVDESILTEYSHVERHGKVTQSIIGPNSGIAEGEVTSCLVGPFVGFHHQALLIAAVWPEGKGNVGYGANVGSNHTSKAPDQEIWCGEGAFLGLGVNVKFPSDFSEAPYSIIATGTDTLPQKVSFPFSLINKPSSIFPGISPAINEIFPGWVLSDNIYLLKRNEGKFKKRNKAKRTSFCFDVFRPDTIEMMVQARDRLRAVEKERAIYTDREVHGLGKNVMTEASRIRGMAAYDFYIEYYALEGLFKRAFCHSTSSQNKRIQSLYDDPTSDAVWEHQRDLLAAEGFSGQSIQANLKRFAEMQEQIARDVEKTKAKDDVRGEKIIRDYRHVNTLAADDAFVRHMWEETAKIKEMVNRLINT